MTLGELFHSPLTANIAFIVPAILNLILIGLILARRYQNLAVIWFLMFLSALSLWGFADFFGNITTNPAVYEFWTAAAASGFISLPALLLQFTLNYTGREKLSHSFWLLSVLGFSISIFLFLAWHSGTIIDTSYAGAVPQWWGLRAPVRQHFPIFLIWFELLSVLALALLISYRHAIKSPIKRKQINLLVGAVLVPLIGGTITNGIFPLLEIETFPLAVPLTSVMSLIIGYALLKYGLFDLDPKSIAPDLIETMSEALLVLDQDLDIQFANQRASSLLGIENNLLLYQPMQALFQSKVEFKTFKSRLLAQPANSSGDRITVSLITGGKGAIEAKIASSKIIGSSRYSSGFVLAIDDVTEDNQRKTALAQTALAQAKLNKSLGEAKLGMSSLLEDLAEEKKIAETERIKDEAMLSSIGDGIIATNEYGRITKVNQAILDMIGFTEKELLGQWLPKVITAKDQSGKILMPEERNVTQALALGEPVSSRYRYMRKDGSEIPVAATASPVILGGKPVGAIISVHDITREIELENARLEFISLASHQLRTPLSAIKWFSEMLAEGDAGKLNPEQAEFVDNVVVSANRMVELVNTLLNISRIESGRISLIPQPTKLSALVEHTMKELTPKLEEKKIKLSVTATKNLPLINIDPQLIGEVYANLLSNAIKYTQENGEIKVAITREEDQIISEITDNGYGIPLKDQSKVFSKFFRAGNVVSKVTSGTGLGLYLVKIIVESSGGKIWFKSAGQGKGSTFWFTLPVAGSKARKGEVPLNA